MATILVINCGSSSIKYQLFEARNGEAEAVGRGIVERIGENRSAFWQKTERGEIGIDVAVKDHTQGFQLLVEGLLNREKGAIEDLSQIHGVGHRVVHGGSAFFDSVIITPEVVEKIREYAALAPLHNPANLTGIEEAQKLLSGAVHVAVFDTAFHQTIPQRAYLYAIPYEYYERYELRRYGFHGISHQYVAHRAAELLARPLSELRIITCHLGAGSSMAAIDGGRCVDTSMGLTPLEGLVMGTRCGDIDPAIIFFLANNAGMSLDKIYNLLNRRSGLLGISGVGIDMREITKQARLGHKRCELALEVFAYRVKKYIGAYSAVLGGLDALVFTAGIGENAADVRAMICENLGFLGLKVDDRQNAEVIGKEGFINATDSKVKVLVVPTNEEKMIALQVIRLLGE